MEVKKRIFDNVHGFIPLNETEVKIVNHPLFQRLRRVRQLGMANYVFPGAEHTRFSHSIGALYTVNEICEVLRKEAQLKEEEEIAKLRLAALLHDVGHYPISHTIEQVMIQDKDAGKKAKHENMSEKIVTESSIKDIIGKDVVQEVSAIIQGTHSISMLNQLVSSELDADRLDYLVRDSLHTGVAMGRIDSAQLIRSFVLDNEGLVGIIPKARHAAESFIFARFHMYSQVYSHKTVGCFDLLIQKAYQLLMDKGQLPSFSAMAEPFNEDLFCKLDDFYLFTIIHESMRSSDPYLSEICRMIINRLPLKLVAECRLIKGASSGADPEYYRPYFALDTFKNKSEEELNQDERSWILFDAPDVRLSYLRPHFDAVQNPKDPEKELNKKEWIGAIKVVDPITKTSSLLINDSSSLLRHIGAVTVDILRLYSKNDPKYLTQADKKLASYGISNQNFVGTPSPTTASNQVLMPS